MDNRIIGISTGVLYKLGIPMNESIQILADLGCNGIELGYVAADRVKDDPLENINHELLKKFSWISIHAPGSDFKYGDNEETKSFFKSFEDFNAITPIDLIVFHPDSFADLSVLNPLTLPVGIENMDIRKASYQFADQLAPVFSDHPSWSMVLDVNHCFTHDPTMQLAEDLKNRFLPKIKEVHLSGYSELHDPLFKTNQDIILKATPPDIPIIIESTVQSMDEIKKEFDYIKDYLTNK